MAAVVDVKDDVLVLVEVAGSATAATVRAGEGQAELGNGSPDEEVAARVAAVADEPGVQVARVSGRSVRLESVGVEDHGNARHRAAGTANRVGARAELVAAPSAIALLEERVGSLGGERRRESEE